MIKSLSEDLKNKISAGEVIERPASVVKELVENSLDAGSTEISIVVEKGGHDLIYVSDNGCGISPEELPTAFRRYTTSKIIEFNDLFEINTLGFRGEALASISSVSDVDILSVMEGKEGHELSIKNGVPSEVRPAGGVIGTQITVRNLFYNTPARKKFLKSPKTEFRKIVEMVRRFALAYPEVSFKLVSDNRSILNLSKEVLDERIASVMDPTYKDLLLPVEFSKGDYQIDGYVGNLNLLRSRPGEQYLFLNRRFIKNRLLNSGVYQAFQSLLKRGEYPFFALNLSVPNDQVDVNVHPMKTEVRFKDEWRLYHVLKSAVIQAVDPILDTIPNFEKPVYNSVGGFGLMTGDVGSTQAEVDQAPIPFLQQKPEKFHNPTGLERAKTYVSTLAERPIPERDRMDLEQLWQVHSKYIVSQINSGLVLIDQHVAHERVLYEEAMAAFEASPMAAQTLLFPEVMEFSPDDFSVLLDVLPFLEKMGFRMREFGQNTVMVEAIPSEMGWGNEKKIIREMLDHYLETQKQYSSYQEALAASFACKAAVKAGDPLTREEMQELVNRLFGTKHPYYCPHGRPIIIQLSMEELDRRFERI